jgi:N-acetylglucosamine-6-phosphate deacetylase
MNSSEHTKPERFLARTLFDGTGGPLKKDVLIETDRGRFTKVETYARGQISGTIREFDIVGPGLIDIQINGAIDVQFNDDPTIDAIKKISVGAAKGGTAWILPTYITDFGHNYQKALRAARDAIERNTPEVLGVHLEGPFLSPRRPGIHPAAAIRQLSNEDMSISSIFPDTQGASIKPCG